MTHLITSSCTGCTACVKICPTGAINGERNSQYTIAADICIDCGACGLICPFEAVVDENGQLCQMVKRSQWKKPQVNQGKCVSCGICIEVCPTGVLEFKDRTDGNPSQVAFLADAKNCISCAFCEADCPTQAIEMLAPGPR